MNLRTIDHPEIRAERVLGTLTGMVTNLEFKQVDRDLGDVTTTEITTTAIEQLLPQDIDTQISIEANGPGSTTEEATIKAIGEFLERYSLYRPHDELLDEIHEGTWHERRQSDIDIVDLEYLQTWHESDIEGTRYEQFDPKRSRDWAVGTDLITGRDVQIPARFVLFDPCQSPRSYVSSTNGNACGSSLAGALVSSVYEQIERDAVMRTWYERRSPDVIDVAGTSIETEFEALFSNEQFEVTLLDLPTPTECSVVTAIGVNRDESVPKFMMLVGAHRDEKRAIRDALDELLQTLVQAKYLFTTDYLEDRGVEDIDEAYNFTDNYFHYLYPENFPTTKFLLEGDRRPFRESPDTTPETAADELELILQDLEENLGATAVGFDITPDDVRTLGMYITYVYVPELIEICLPPIPPAEHPRMGEIEMDVGHPFP